ncbi:class I SAM-dependent methyltransferase [Streptomyces noursei]|uniref:class I SAM-dependent methyltransferase n=1 Tax=Streptomyces noursei TaxID=1971 RepID=UPI0023B80818|nr:class I SAM-dependent methyltransferase [Streptomyces noursei]
MTPAQWEALLYDWHNAHRLRRQRDDTAYWTRLTEPHDSVLVLGAGTGRVAGALARSAERRVMAVDLSRERLARIPRTSGLHPVCGDMRRLPFQGPHSAAVIPYSTLQLLLTPEDRERALAETARVLAPGGSVHIDVSESFDSRTETDWQLSLAETCPEAGGPVEEWERSRPHADHVAIEKQFRRAGRVLTEVTERWVYHRALDLAEVLARTGFELLGIDRGYGRESSPHRLVYHARRRH